MPIVHETSTTPAVACRDMRGRDIPAVVAMAARLAAHHGDQSALTDAFLRREAFSSTPLVKILVADAGGMLAGYAALVPTMQLQFGLRGMELHHLHVDEAHRGAGIGRTLLAASVERARGLGCAYMTVGTHAGNGSAQAFYEKSGFLAVVGAGPRYRMALGGDSATIRMAG